MFTKTDKTRWWPLDSALLTEHTRQLLEGLSAPGDHADLVARSEPFTTILLAGQWQGVSASSL